MPHQQTIPCQMFVFSSHKKFVVSEFRIGSWDVAKKILAVNLINKYKLNKIFHYLLLSVVHHCREVRFASFLSGAFTTMEVINQPERKLAKRTSVHWSFFQRAI